MRSFSVSSAYLAWVSCCCASLRIFSISLTWSRSVFAGSAGGTLPSSPGLLVRSTRSGESAGEKIDLVRIGRRGEGDDLVESGVLEPGHGRLDRVGVLGRSLGDRLGVGAEKGVVVAELLPCRRLGGLAEREVEERHRPRLVGTAGGGPRHGQLIPGLGESSRVSATHRPAVGVLRGPAEGGVGRTSDQDLRAAVGRRRTDSALALPEPVELVELTVEGLPSRLEVRPADR